MSQTPTELSYSGLNNNSSSLTSNTNTQNALLNNASNINNNLSALTTTTTANNNTIIPSTSSLKKHHKENSFTHMLAGSVAGMASKTILQPLDLVKVRLQVQDGRGVNEYRGIIHAISSIVRNEGILGLYRGLTPNLMAAGVSWGVYFFSYNQFKQAFKRRASNKLSSLEQVKHSDSNYKHVHLGPLTHLLCAACSGMLATTITNPISMVKTRLQLQGKEIQTETRMYTGVVDAFIRITREEGLKTFYRGLGPSLILVSNGALQFMCYEELKKICAKYVGGEQFLSPHHYFAMGGLAKIFSATVTYPFAVTRARLFALAPDPQILQSHANNNNKHHNNNIIKQHKYEGMRDVFSSTFQNEGWRGFYRGLVPQLIKTAPSSAITFLIYETVIKLLNPIATVSTNPSASSTTALISQKP